MRQVPSFIVRSFVAGNRRPLLGLAFALVVLGGLQAEIAQAQPAMPVPQVWTGRMQVPEGVEPGETGDTFELRIFRPSTEVEAAGLVKALQAGGQVALRNAMFQLPVKGWIKIGNLAATDVVFVRVVDLPDGQRRVRLYSDHALRLYDKSDPAGSTAHPFAFLELFADASGKGSGSLVASASLAADDEELRMESAGVPVIQIYNVTTDRPPAAPKSPAPPAKP
jgi:hypothetical protein